MDAAGEHRLVLLEGLEDLDEHPDVGEHAAGAALREGAPYGIVFGAVGGGLPRIAAALVLQVALEHLQVRDRELQRGDLAVDVPGLPRPGKEQPGVREDVGVQRPFLDDVLPVPLHASQLVGGHVAEPERDSRRAGGRRAELPRAVSVRARVRIFREVVVDRYGAARLRRRQQPGEDVRHRLDDVPEVHRGVGIAVFVGGMAHDRRGLRDRRALLEEVAPVERGALDLARVDELRCGGADHIGVAGRLHAIGAGIDPGGVVGGDDKGHHGSRRSAPGTVAEALEVFADVGPEHLGRLHATCRDGGPGATEEQLGRPEHPAELDGAVDLDGRASVFGVHRVDVPFQPPVGLAAGIRVPGVDLGIVEDPGEVRGGLYLADPAVPRDDASRGFRVPLRRLCRQKRSHGESKLPLLRKAEVRHSALVQLSRRPHCKGFYAVSGCHELGSCPRVGRVRRPVEVVVEVLGVVYAAREPGDVGDGILVGKGRPVGNAELVEERVDHAGQEPEARADLLLHVVEGHVAHAVLVVHVVDEVCRGPQPRGDAEAHAQRVQDVGVSRGLYEPGARVADEHGAGLHLGRDVDVPDDAAPGGVEDGGREHAGGVQDGHVPCGARVRRGLGRDAGCVALPAQGRGRRGLRRAGHEPAVALVHRGARVERDVVPAGNGEQPVHVEERLDPRVAEPRHGGRGELQPPLHAADAPVGLPLLALLVPEDPRVDEALPVRREQGLRVRAGLHGVRYGVDVAEQLVEPGLREQVRVPVAPSEPPAGRLRVQHVEVGLVAVVVAAEYLEGEGVGGDHRVGAREPLPRLGALLVPDDAEALRHGQPRADGLEPHGSVVRRGAGEPEHGAAEVQADVPVGVVHAGVHGGTVEPRGSVGGPDEREEVEVADVEGRPADRHGHFAGLAVAHLPLVHARRQGVPVVVEQALGEREPQGRLVRAPAALHDVGDHGLQGLHDPAVARRGGPVRLEVCVRHQPLGVDVHAVAEPRLRAVDVAYRVALRRPPERPLLTGNGPRALQRVVEHLAAGVRHSASGSVVHPGAVGDERRVDVPHGKGAQLGLDPRGVRLAAVLVVDRAADRLPAVVRVRPLLVLGEHVVDRAVVVRDGRGEDAPGRDEPPRGAGRPGRAGEHALHPRAVGDDSVDGGGRGERVDHVVARRLGLLGPGPVGHVGDLERHELVGGPLEGIHPLEALDRADPGVRDELGELHGDRLAPRREVDERDVADLLVQFRTRQPVNFLAGGEQGAHPDVEEVLHQRDDATVAVGHANHLAVEGVQLHRVVVGEDIGAALVADAGLRVVHERTHDGAVEEPPGPIGVAGRISHGQRLGERRHDSERLVGARRGDVDLERRGVGVAGHLADALRAVAVHPEGAEQGFVVGPRSGAPHDPVGAGTGLGVAELVGHGFAAGAPADPDEADPGGLEARDGGPLGVHAEQVEAEPVAHHPRHLVVVHPGLGELRRQRNLDYHRGRMVAGVHRDVHDAGAPAGALHLVGGTAPLEHLGGVRGLHDVLGDHAGAEAVGPRQPLAQPVDRPARVLREPLVDDGAEPAFVLAVEELLDDGLDPGHRDGE